MDENNIVKTNHPPTKYLISYALTIILGLYPLTLYAPTDARFNPALAATGIILVVGSIYSGRKLYIYQPLPVFQHYVLNSAVVSGIFGVMLLGVAFFNLLFS